LETIVDHALDPNRPPADAARRLLVLLVDDQSFVGAAIGQLIATERDVELQVCLHARDAVATANRLNPAVILQDLVMPEINGMTLVQRYRENPATAKTPVIVLSGNDDPETRARALAQGANDYLVKLPAKQDLIGCIRRWTHANGAGSAGQPPGSADRTAAATATATAPAADEILDRSVLQAYMEGDARISAGFTRSLIDRFVREAASQVDMLEEALRHRDATQAKAIAHSLRGSSMTMGARRLAALCGRIENGGGQSDAGAALPAEIDREFASVRDALAAERQKLDRP
jgi:CheY-like chemotaxis protein